MKYVRIDIGISIKEMTRLTEEAVEKNLGFIEEHGDFDIWHAITRGPGRWAYEANAPTVIIDVAPIPWDWFGSDLNGAKGVITKTRSMSSQTVDPKIKHHSRLNFNLAEMEAGDIEDHGWPVLTDGSGNLTEGVGYNLFTVTNGVIRTPNDTSILQGVSRGYVLELAEQLGMQVIEEDLQPYDLYTADEAFFSSTPYCLLPVTAFDKRDIGDGKPGPVFKQLMSAWSERVGVDVVGQAEKHYQKML
tara:strand:- start:250 stop:987 length:738 start_codon:yes stop_codon:yes gene_type:complete